MKELIHWLVIVVIFSMLFLAAGIISKTHASTSQNTPQKIDIELSEENGIPFHTWDIATGCIDVRNFVLMRDSVVSVTFDEQGCKVLTGRWYDRYEGKYFTDINEIVVDFSVPLREVEKSGGASWDEDTKRLYKNYLTRGHLIVIGKDTFRERHNTKGDNPTFYMPKSKYSHFEYLRRWAEVKENWHLGMTEHEYNSIVQFINGNKNNGI